MTIQLISRLGVCSRIEINGAKRDLKKVRSEFWRLVRIRPRSFFRWVSDYRKVARKISEDLIKGYYHPANAKILSEFA